MTEFARKQAETIANHLEKKDISSVDHVRRNLRALIVNSTVWVEQTLDVISAAQNLEHEVKLFLEQSRGPMGIPDSGPGAEAQRQRAVQAARRFEAVIEAAPPSGRARALGVG